jgi:transposase
VEQVKAERIPGRTAILKTNLQELKEIEVQLNETTDKQNSLTDPEVRLIKTQDTGMVGYNVQAAVDAKYHLIVLHEVTKDGVDRVS